MTVEVNCIVPAMHSLVAASRPRLSETEPRWSNPSLRKVNVNKVNIVYGIISYSLKNSTCKLFLSMYSFIMLTMR